MQRETTVCMENVPAWEKNTSQIQNPPQCIKKCGIDLNLIRHKLLMLVSQGFKCGSKCNPHNCTV